MSGTGVSLAEAKARAKEENDEQTEDRSLGVTGLYGTWGLAEE